MKKLFALILAMLMLVLAVGCDEKETAKTPVEENGEEVNYWIEGLEFYAERDYEAAVEAFSLAIEDGPYPYDLMYRGETYLTLGGEENIALARTDFEEALELYPTLTHATRCLAYVTYLEGDSEGARAMLENTLSEEASESLFDVCALYCQGCGSFEHTTHPAVSLEDKSDAELIEISDYAIEKYYDYTYPPVAFRSYGIELEENDTYTLDEYDYVDGYQIIELYDESSDFAYTRDHAVIKCRYIGAVDTGFITFETDTFKFWGGDVYRQDGIDKKEYEIPFVAERDDARSGSYEGRLYDVAGKDITDAFVESVKLYGCLSYPAQKSTNVTTVAEVTEMCREHFSYKLLKKFTAFSSETNLLEYNGELYCNVHMPGMSYEYPSVDYESAEILSRTDSSFTVRYYFDYHELINTCEAVCTFGEENGNLVMLDIVEKDWYNVEMSAKRLAELEDFELLTLAENRLSRYYDCSYAPFSTYGFGIETEDDGYGYYNEEVDGYQIIRLYNSWDSTPGAENTDYDNHVIKCRYKGVFDAGFFTFATDSFKFWWGSEYSDAKIKEYENRIDAEGVICSYEGRLYDLKGEDITDAFVKAVEQRIAPDFIFPAGKSTNFNSLDEVKKAYRSYFSEELSKGFDSSLDRKRTSLEYNPPIEFNGGLYCNYYVPGMGFGSPWVDYSTGEIISRDGSSFVVRYEHGFDELISIKESICTFGEENGRIVLMSVEDIYFTPEEIEEHMREIYENW